MYIPTVITKINGQEFYYDLYSRLLKDRIVMLNDVITDDLASSIIGQLLFLDNESNEEITLFISSPGGSVTAGLSIMDTMDMIKSPVKTICTGCAASMGAFLLTCGATRYATKSSRIMLHSVSGGVGDGVIHDVEIDFKETQFLQNYLMGVISKKTGQTTAKIKRDTKRDFWMSAEQAVKYGLIDGVV